MKIKKPTKKEMIYIAVLVVIAIIVWLLMRSKNNTVTVNGAGQPADTGYLNFNMPPIGSDGLQVPQFGNINVPPINLGGGCCNDCDTPKYYGSNQDLANALGSTGYDNVQAALENLPNYMVVDVTQRSQAGTIDGVNYAVTSHLPVLALAGGTTDTIIDQPAQTSNYAPSVIKAL